MSFGEDWITISALAGMRGAFSTGARRGAVPPWTVTGPGMNAPLCVAKGADNIALKIREIAREHDIPIVENVPLARALYATVDIDDEIPVEHYHAVAEIIGYVMGLKRGFNVQRRS